MNFDQGQFNFDARDGEDGYRHWREELEQRKHDFESRWGIILGSRVQIQLTCHPHPFEGFITLITEEDRRDHRPHLRIGTIEFSPQEVDSIMRLDDPP